MRLPHVSSNSTAVIGPIESEDLCIEGEGLVLVIDHDAAQSYLHLSLRD
jgi:hypothetical protein